MDEEFKKRLKFEIGIVISTLVADNIIDRIEEYEDIWEKQYLRLFSDVAKMEVFPKQIELDPVDKKGKVVFLGKHPNANKIPYLHDIAWPMIEKLGYTMQRDYIKYKTIFYSSPKQKSLTNKYCHLDSTR